ncbi:MAG TPA: response regulator [Nannocystaceae bacterium]|nr:response regulator [Nannocystaceae bacterium]
MTPTRILLVEDNPGDARLVSALLEGSDFDPIDIVHVTALAEATERLAHETFDAIVLDLGLPDSSGLDTLQRLRLPDSTVPLLVLSGNDDDELRGRATALGADDWVTKDELDEFRLSRSLASALARARLVSELDDAQRIAESSEARLADLMAHAFEPMLVLSAARRGLFANVPAGEALGLPVEKLVGTHLRLSVGDGRTEWIETRSMGGSVRSGRVGVRSFPTQWRGAPAWLVALEPAAVGPASTGSAVNVNVAASASEIHARAVRTSAGIDTARTQVRKARELLRGWARTHSPAETRALMDEVLEVAAATLDDASHEVQRVEGMAHHVLRNHCGSGRVLELGTIDSVIREAVQRAADQLGTPVRVKFHNRADGVLASDAPRVAPLVERLVTGLGRWVGGDVSEGIDLHVETRVTSSAIVLTFDVDPGAPTSSVSMRILRRSVDRIAETESTLDGIVRSLRDLGAVVSFGKRADGSVWVGLEVAKDGT